MQEIFEDTQSEVLRGAIIWTPMLKTDNVVSAIRCELNFSDFRLIQFWDPDRKFGSLLSQTLALSIPIAWDVYLLYPPVHPWKAALPPSPEFWMHQQNEELSLYLDPVRFKKQVKALLERTSLNG